MMTQHMGDAVAGAFGEEATRRVGPKDFSASKPPVEFTVDGDVFSAPGDLPVLTLIEFAERASGAGGASTLTQDVLVGLFELILYPTSAEQFIARMRDSERPIGLEQVMEIIPWLLEQYGLRPTEESKDSSAGSDNPGVGRSSTDVGSGEASTFGGSI